MNTGSNTRHASVHFSSGGEISIKNLSGQTKTKRKGFGNKLKTSSQPVSLQRLFNASHSEMGESIATNDFSIDNSQVLFTYYFN